MCWSVSEYRPLSSFPPSSYDGATEDRNHLTRVGRRMTNRPPENSSPLSLADLGSSELAGAEDSLTALAQALAKERTYRASSSYSSSSSSEIMRVYMPKRRVDVRDLFDKLKPLLCHRLDGVASVEMAQSKEPLDLPLEAARLTQLILAVADFLAAPQKGGTLRLSLVPPRNAGPEVPARGAALRFVMESPSPNPASTYPAPSEADLLRRATSLGANVHIERDARELVRLVTLSFASASDPQNGALPAPDNQRHCILLAEDDDLVLSITERLLTHRGYRVQCARNGEEAELLFLANKDAIDLVLLDLHMPKKHGGQVLCDILQVKPGQRFIVVSGYGPDANTRRLLEEHGIPFLPKPYAPELLLRLISDALRAPEGLRLPAEQK